MKLPQSINVNTQSYQSNRTQELNDVLRVKQAENMAMGQAFNAAIAWEKTRDEIQLAETVDNSLREYKKMQTSLNQAGAVDLANEEMIPVELRDNILKSRGEELKNIKDEDGFANVPAHEVRGEVHDYFLDKIIDEGKSSISSKKKIQSRYVSAMAQPTINGATAILKKNLNEKRMALSSNADRLYGNAIMDGSVEQAVNIITTAEDTGIWSAEKVNSKLATVQGDVEFSNGIAVILNGDTDDILTLQGSLASGSKMTNGQKWELHLKSENAISAIQDKYNHKSKTASSHALNNELIELDSAGGFSEGRLRQATQSMNPEHARIIIGVNRAVQNSASARRDDPATESRLALMVARLAIPQDDMPYEQRIQTAYSEIYSAMGYDQATETNTGKSAITSATAIRLINDINKSSERLLADPRFEASVDYGYKLITGASKQAFGFGAEVGQTAAAVAQFEYDFIHAYLETGPGFDSSEWFDNNIFKYQSAASRENMDLNAQDIAERLILRDGDVLNLEKSVEAVKEKLGKGLIDDSEAIEYIDRIYRLKKEEIQHAQNVENKEKGR